MQTDSILAFDIGGTSIKYGVIEKSASTLKFLYKNEVPSDAKKIQGPGILDKIMHIVEQTINDGLYRIDGIAISTAGVVDPDAGSIVYANENIPAYTGLQIKNVIENKFNLSCWVENDVNCAALGETIFGAGKNASSSVMLTIGTGVGGSIVLNGEIIPGFNGCAGEIGYMKIDDGTLETKASTTALVHSVENKTKESNLNGKTIFQRAIEGDEICINAIDSMCDYLMQGISHCVCLIDPEVVILGGGIMKQEKYLGPLILKYQKHYCDFPYLKSLHIRFAKLGNDAGMAGAFYNFLKREK